MFVQLIMVLLFSLHSIPWLSIFTEKFAKNRNCGHCAGGFHGGATIGPVADPTVEPQAGHDVFLQVHLN